ncbi:MAG: SsrA-binding protein SmpB [Chlamydiota bacterium]|nr:SsrA-binding protein SmpB [Chlamydiota bacterium]
MPTGSPHRDLASNRKARHHYDILDTYEAGLLLLGTEVKSLRTNGGSIQEAYVVIDKGEVWLKKASIVPYQMAHLFNHEEIRDRKLLLHHREILKLKQSSQEKGLTIIPLSLYLKRGNVKIKIALAKGRSQYDKRTKLKE